MPYHAWFRYPTLLVSITAGFLFSLFYWNLDPTTKQKYSSIEHSLDITTSWLIKKFTKTAPSESLWNAFETMLPPEILRNREAYQIEILQSPVLIQSNAALHWTVSDLCNILPEWGSIYAPTQLKVSDGYYAFLTSLEPILPQIASPSDQKRLKTLADRLNQNAHKTNSLSERRISQNSDNSNLNSEIDSILEKYRASARSRGLRSAGAADYFTGFWNAAYEEERPGSVTTLVKRCDADGLEAWIRSDAGRPILIKGGTEPGANEKLPAAGPDQAWEYLDLGDTRLFEVKDASGVQNNGASTISVQARRLKVFWLKRPGWFSSEAIRLFGKTGPWAPDRPVKNPARDLWGTHGVLRLLPTALLVIDSPSASIRMSHDDFQSLNQWSRANPSSVSTSFPSVIMRQHGNGVGLELRGNSYDVHMLPNAQLAYVVAVLSVKMPLTSSYD